jgi:CRISPR/Cas system-associated exonuclease Cas4 (RecB family)
VGSAYFLRKQVQDHLHEFLEQYQLPLVDKNRIMISALERNVDVEYNGHRFSGRIDRIEQRDGRTVILDYKTGHDEKVHNINMKNLDVHDRSSWNEAIHSFQLPMYMLLYAALTKQSPDAITPAYVFLGKNKLNISIEVGLGNEGESPAYIYRSVEPVIFAMIDEILDGQKPFHPTNDLEQHCPRCPYNTICGTQWVKGWEGQ